MEGRDLDEGRAAQIVGTKTGKFPTLNIAPHAFYRIQFSSVGGQAHNRWDGKPSPIGMSFFLRTSLRQLGEKIYQLYVVVAVASAAHKGFQPNTF
jgi:hypothetical protein